MRQAQTVARIPCFNRPRPDSIFLQSSCLKLSPLKRYFAEASCPRVSAMVNCSVVASSVRMRRKIRLLLREYETTRPVNDVVLLMSHVSEAGGISLPCDLEES